MPLQNLLVDCVVLEAEYLSLFLIFIHITYIKSFFLTEKPYSEVLPSLNLNLRPRACQLELPEKDDRNYVMLYGYL